MLCLVQLNLLIGWRLKCSHKFRKTYNRHKVLFRKVEILLILMYQYKFIQHKSWMMLKSRA